jgi:hypothetical protein
MSPIKTYTLYGYSIDKIEKGYYRIHKGGRFKARKSTLELAKAWVRNDIKQEGRDVI